MRQVHINGERYCGNYLTKKVHDLKNVQKKCSVESMTAAGVDIPFESLEVALRAGYSNCENCICIIEKSD